MRQRNIMRNCYLLSKYRKPIGLLMFGALAGGVYVCVMTIMVSYFNRSIFFGSVVGYMFGFPISYLGNRHISYKSKNPIGREAFRFLMAQIVNLLLTSLAVQSICSMYSCRSYVAGLIGVICAPIISVILFECWVYRQFGGNVK